MSKLNDASSITQTIRRADGDISFADTLGSFVQNAEFKKGYVDLRNGKDTPSSYVWKALSAIGQDVNSITYSNVLNYVDAVSNIDTCAVKSLKSMMKLVGSSYDIFGDIDMLPIEVVQLLDVMSISRKYLLQSDKLKEALIEDIKQSGVVEDYNDTEDQLHWKYQYLRSSFTVSADNVQPCINSIYSRYMLAEDYAYTYLDGKLDMSAAVLSDFSGYSDSIFEADGQKTAGIVCRSYESSTGWKIVKYYECQEAGQAGSEHYAVVDKDRRLQYLFSAEEFESSVSEEQNTSILSHTDGYIQLVPEQAVLKTDFISADRYRAYVKQLFSSLLYSIVTMRYNTRNSDVKHIYCYLRDEYYKTNDWYEKIDNSEDSRRRFKSKNNIPLSFDEKRIVDDIDNGTDQLDNYFGAEFELLNIEIAYRARTLSFSELGLQASSSDNIVEKYTRYSYYRKAKVLEYMHFIDNQYYSGNTYLSASGVYEFNPSYYEVEKRKAEDCNVVKKLDEYSDDPSQDLNLDVIDAVAQNLADLTMYIAKLREKVRLQTRKNYMKGTNNLIRYVVNEYLVDLARNSQLFKDDASGSNYLSAVRAELSSNDIDNVEVVEYYDTTEYYNVSTSTSDKAQNGNYVNDRYWENAIAQDLDGNYTSRDGIDIPQEEIHKFYLSTLNLKNAISGADSNIYAFLSTIFDLGANTSYIASDGAFVTKLSSGQYSDEVHDMYLKLSAAYDQISEYSEGYAFDVSHTASQQLSDLAVHLESKVSAEYFANVSANYIKYMPETQQLSSQVVDLQAQYDAVLSDNAAYLAKSSSKYSYDNGKYKHDYYIGNYEVYNSTMLLDKLGDLRQFASDSNNMHVWEFSDGISALSQQFNDLSGRANSIRESMYLAGIEFNDINSEFLDDEIQCLDDATKDAISQRRKQLEQIVSTGRSNAEHQYDLLLQQLQSAIDEYHKMEQDYADVVSKYKCPYVNGFGSSELQYSTYTKGKSDSASVNVKYKTISIAGLEQAEKIEDKCKAAIDWMSQPIDLEGGNSSSSDSDDSDYEYGTEAVVGDIDSDDGSEITAGGVITVKFGSKVKIPDSTYVLADAGVQGALQQMSDRIEVLKKNIQNAQALLNPLNLAFYTVYSRLNSVYAYPGDIQFDLDQLDDTDVATQYDSLATQLKEKYIEQSGHLDEADKLFINDKQYYDLNTLQSYVVQLSSNYESFDEEYQQFVSGRVVSEYLDGYQMQDRFSQRNYDGMIAFSTSKDDDSRHSILNQIDMMYTQYYDIQYSYTKLMQELKQQMPRYYYTNNYLESDLQNVADALIDDVHYNTDLAQIKMDTHMAQLQKSIESLAEGISASLSLSGSTVLQLFSREIQKYDVYSDPQYIAAKELFYQYTGLSSSHAPFFNYKNTAHPTYQTHDFMWNFIEADKYLQIANNAFDSVYIEDLETQIALSTVNDYIGNCGQLIDTWKHNVQDYTGYSTRYVDSPHLVPTYIGKFEVADYDGAFYPPAIEMFREDPAACIHTLVSQFSVIDNINAFRLNEDIAEDLGIYTAQEFYISAWVALDGSEYTRYVPDGNMSKVLNDFIANNSVPGYSYTGEAVTWMTSTKEDFAKYATEHINKTFFERFYYPLGLSKQNYIHIAKQLSCDEIQSQILEITKGQERKDLYDIYQYGLDIYDNMYILYKQYGEEKPTYQTKKNTLGQMWIRLKDHPIAFPIVLSSDTTVSPVELSSANTYIANVDAADTKNWCYDFMFSDNKRLVCFTCKNKTEDLPEYFAGKYKYSQQALALVSQKTNVDLNRPVLKISNPDDVPDDIVTQPYLKSFELPTTDTSSYAYQFLGPYAPSMYNLNLVYAKTNFTYDDKLSIVHASLDCPPDIVVLKATNESMNIELQGQLSAAWKANEFMFDDEHSMFKFDNDQAVFSYNFPAKTLTFAFLGDLLLENGDIADKYSSATCAGISLSTETSGAVVQDPAAKEMNSYDVFTDCVVLANAKQTALGLNMQGHVKLYNMNADASYLPLYAGPDKAACIEDMKTDAPYYAFELLGSSKNLDDWISRANPYADIGIDLTSIMKDKVNGRVWETGTQEKFAELCAEISSTAYEAYCPLMNDQYASYDEQSNSYKWTIEMQNASLAYDNNKLDDVRVVVTNVDLYGKNPYYVCTLRDMLSSRNPDGSKPACYNAEPADLQQTDVSSTVFSKNAPCKAVSTQPYALLNQSDNNNIAGISAMNAVYDDQLSTLELQFKLSGDSEDIFVPKGQVKVMMFNPAYLEAFEHYHMLDIYGLLYIYDTDNIKLDKVGDGWYITYDNSRFEIGPYYIDKHGYKHKLEDVHLSDYTQLSDVYVLQGTERLHYKYNEQDIYDISSDMYYYPSVNIKYPYTPGTYLESLGFEKGLRTGSYFEKMFDNTNYYTFRIDKPKEVANKIGNVSILIQGKDLEVALAYEDYANNGAEAKYDYSDKRNFEYLQFVSDNQCSSYYEVEDSFLDECNDIEDAINMIADSQELPISAFGADASIQSGDVVPQLTFKASSETVNLDDALKVYVSYKKEDDQSITLYFNYMNYLDTPYVKIVDNRPVPDVVDGTFLKLKAGEEGTLDLMVQFKYYAKQIVYGVANVVLVTYKMFNLSDTKPKFLVYKQQTVTPNAYEYIDVKMPLELKVETREVSRNDLDARSGQYYINIRVDAKSNGSPLSDTNSFKLKYNAAVLQYSSMMSTGCKVNSEQPGSLSLLTYEQDVPSFVIRFLVKNADTMFKTSDTVVTLSIDDVDYFYSNGDRVTSIKTVPGTILFKKDQDEQED